MAVVLFGLVAGPGCQAPLDSAASSHVDANVPDQKDFHTILQRDLETYLRSETNKSGVRVEYELLREGPTQPGVSYPKYYLWARALDGKNVALDGAVRVAAVDKLRFDVTDFLSREEIIASPSALQAVFPSALIGKILGKARGK